MIAEHLHYKGLPETQEQTDSWNSLNADLEIIRTTIENLIIVRERIVSDMNSIRPVNSSGWRMQSSKHSEQTMMKNLNYILSRMS